MAKISNSELIETAKRDFQYSVSGLLEIHQDLERKTDWAKNNKKKFISYSTQEAELISGLVIELTQELMTAYGVMHKFLQHTEARNKALEAASKLPYPSAA